MKGRGLALAEETMLTEVHGLSDYINTEKAYNRILQSMGKGKTKIEHKEDIKEQEDWTEKPLRG